MCFVKYFLEIPCPGCGLLHAFWYAIQLKWPESFASFPLWPLVILFFIRLRRNTPPSCRRRSKAMATERGGDERRE
ncbi:MAG: DUF2752 domain-containing protein, partial [Deltaproteobacteria bacterium]|nr:DUF2752 domain-containing protein [Deltaproteobacteria bacterium]